VAGPYALFVDDGLGDPRRVHCAAHDDPGRETSRPARWIVRGRRRPSMPGWPDGVRIVASTSLVGRLAEQQTLVRVHDEPIAIRGRRWRSSDASRQGRRDRREPTPMAGNPRFRRAPRDPRGRRRSARVLRRPDQLFPVRTPLPTGRPDRRRSDQPSRTRPEGENRETPQRADDGFVARR